MSRPHVRGRDFPWWLAAAAMLGIAGALAIAADETYGQILSIIAGGIVVTIWVTIVAFAGAATLGLLLALAESSRWRFVSQSARFYIEIMRGVPMMVLLLYIAFVAAPALVDLYNLAAAPLIERGFLDKALARDFPLVARAILALMLGYAAFLAEIFRAGIQAVDPGLIEAAKALGLTRGQRFRLITLPLAFRTVLPPLGNDFVAMVKDSSLVSVLGVADITQLGKVYAAGSFRFFETYNVVTYIYLLMTISLSLAVRGLEEKLKRRRA